MMVKEGVDGTSVEGAATLPYAIANLAVDLAATGLGTGRNAQITATSAHQPDGVVPKEAVASGIIRSWLRRQPQGHA